MLPIRLALGAIMFAHGAQKVFGVWGGPGFNQWVNRDAPFPEMRPAWLWLGAAAIVGVPRRGVGDNRAVYASRRVPHRRRVYSPRSSGCIGGLVFS